MSETKKANGPVRVEPGEHTVRLTGAQIKPGSKNADTSILHLTFSKVLPNGDVDEAFKPLKEYLGVEHTSENYLNISSKKADVLLKKMGIEEGLAQFNGDIGVFATKEFKKEFSLEEFQVDVYEEDKEESFVNEAGKTITFKRRQISLMD